ncbi:translocation/assembly module TamB domain-containing protein [Pelagibius sp.]|uniref:translocation/assembly module TamB domain-containing protein n=1 Tax=Pelagibius sp. TaxID=1931238 RepID=UPI003BABB2A9
MLKWTAIGLTTVLAVAALSGLLAYGWLESEAGRGWLKRQVEAAVSTPGEIELSIEALEGSPWRKMTARKVTLRDRAGPWLQFGAVEVAWRPGALLRGRLDIEALTVRAAALDRLPAESSQGADPAQTSEGLAVLLDPPLDIRIRKLDADEIALGAPVLGQAARFTLQGETASDGERQLSADFTLQRLDGPEARLRFAAAYDPMRDDLIVDAEAVEAPGGLMATLTELPELPAAELRLNGSGPLKDWNGSLAFALGAVADAEAAIGVMRSAEGGLALRLDGRSTVAAVDPATPWALLAGTTRISMAAAWTADDRIDLQSLSAANDTFNASLSGSVEMAGATVDLAMTASTEADPAVWEGLGLDSLRQGSVDLTVQGPIARPVAVFGLSARDVAAAEFRAAALSAEGRLSAESDLLDSAPVLALDLQGVIDGPQISGADSVNRLLDDQARWSLAGELDANAATLTVTGLEAALGSVKLAAGGTTDLAAGSAEMDMVLDISDLGALQPLTDVMLGGEATLRGPLSLEGFGARIETELAGRWEQPSSDIPALTRATEGGVEIATRLRYADSLLRVENLTAVSAAGRLEGALSVTPAGDLADGRYRLVLPDAARLAADLGAAFTGEASLEGTLAGPADALQTAGRMQAAAVSVGGQELKDIRASYAFVLGGPDSDGPDVEGPDIAGPVELALESPVGALDARAGLRLRADRLTLEALDLRLPEARVDGRIVVPLDTGEPAADLTADLTAEVADLAPWLSLAGLAGSGQGRLAVQLNGAGDAPPLQASAELTALALTMAPDTAPLRVGSAALRLESQGLALDAGVSLTIDADTLAWQRLQLARLDVEGAGTAEAFDVALTTAGNWIEPLDLRLAGRIGQKGETLTIDLAEAEGRLLGQPLALQRPAALTLGPDSFGLRGLDLAYGEARLSGEALLEKEQVQLSAVVEDLPLQSADAVWPSGLEGRASARLELEGTRLAPRGQADLAVTALRPRDATDLPELTLAASALWRGGRLQVEGSLGGAAVAEARFRADAPLRISAAGSLEMPPDEAMSGELGWSGDIATLLLFVPLPEHRLNGDARVAMTAAGSPRAPRIDGSVALTQGRYENLETGTLLRDLEVLARVDGDRVTLTTLTANDGAGGRVTGDGGMTVDPGTGFPFSVSVALDKLHALRRDDVTAVVGGTVQAAGTLEAPRVEGRITTETVEISLLAALPPDVVSLDVTELRDGIVQQRPEETDAPPPVDAALDIVIEMPRRVFVRGRGLDSEWAGRIAVAGSASAPEVTGEIAVVRGQLSVVGKPFALRNGTVTLPGAAGDETSLDITAAYQGQDLDVTARMAGPLSRPALELSSTPALPRDEILSRVLFNKASSGLSGAEAAQLALAVQELRGEGASGILDFARRTLGVDVLRVDTNDGGAPAVEAGRYLTDGVYVGVKQGASAQSSAAGVEVELTPNITVESEVTGSGANKSGVRFQWDY